MPRSRPKGWRTPLSRPLRTIDGVTIKTLADARGYAVKLPDQYSLRNHWQHAAQLMLAAAEGGDILAASVQVHKALFLDMRLDVVKTPA